MLIVQASIAKVFGRGIAMGWLSSVRGGQDL
jgi:hypothetical protein